MLIVFDGPEKAGKTSIITGVYRALHEQKTNCIIKKWGPVFPDDRVYADEAVHDAKTDLVVLWDRCWASEHVYANLLNRMDRRLRLWPEQAEYTYGRSASVRIMVLPYSTEICFLKRDNTDLVTSVQEECKMFKDYAAKFGWHVFFNDYTHETLQINIRRALTTIEGQNYLMKEVISNKK